MVFVQVHNLTGYELLYRREAHTAGRLVLEGLGGGPSAIRCGVGEFPPAPTRLPAELSAGRMAALGRRQPGRGLMSSFAGAIAS